MCKLHIVFLLLIAISFTSYGQGVETLKAIDVYGNIDLGYENGVMPYIGLNESSFLNSNFYTQGDIGLELCKIPLTFAFNYSSNNNNQGYPNYFNLSFDVNRFKSNALRKILDKKNTIQDSIQKITSIRNELEGQLMYLKEMNLLSKDYLKNQISGLKNKVGNIDLGTIPSMDSILNVDFLIPSIDSLPIEGLGLDSLRDNIKSYQAQIENIETKIDNINQELYKLQAINNINPDSLYQQGKTSILDKRAKLLNSVRKLEIGQCSPNYSTFLINRTTIYGFNTEFNSSKIYLAASYGKSQENVFFSTNQLNTTLNQTRNLYNFFDFRDVKNNRTLMSIKGGYGQKESTHFFIGILHGRGKASYSDEQVFNSTEKNYVFELDVRYKFKKNHLLDFIYGRSSLQSDTQSDGIQSLGKTNRSNAAKVSYEGNIDKTNTKIKASVRYIDPFFKSFGASNIRPDNVRYALKIQQKISSKISTGVQFKYEEDNLLGLFTSKNKLYTFQHDFSYKVSKSLLLKTKYTPLFHKQRNDSFKNLTSNQIVNILLSHNKRIKNIRINNTAIYTRYDLSNSEQIKNTYQNVSLISNLIINEKITTGLSVNYYSTSDTLTTNQETYSIDFSQEVMIKKLRAGATVKIITSNQDLDYGVGGQISYNIKDNLRISALAEKVVLNNFYRNIELPENIKPYYFNISMNYNWNTIKKKR